MKRDIIRGEDEVEKLGKRLCAIHREEHLRKVSAMPPRPYAESSTSVRATYDTTALRFRDECVGPQRELEAAARLVGETSRRAESATDEIRADWIVSYRDMMRLLNALPGQGEAPK